MWVAVGSALFGAGVAMLISGRWSVQADEEEVKDERLASRTEHAGYTRTEQIVNTMKEVDCFVLDNSLRETTVASIFGHTIEGKYRILEAIRKAGMKHIILGAFGPTRRVDEGFIVSLRDKNQLKDDEHYYAFSEFKDADAPWFEGARAVEDAAASTKPPYGLVLCKRLGIPNAVIEVDLMALWDLPAGTEALCREMEERVVWCRKELRPDSRVLFNLRDFQLAWPTNPDRVLSVVAFLAQLPESTRPFGLCFEDQNGSWLPCIVQDATYEVRCVMKKHGWDDGQLLVHVHKGYGISDASQLAAMGAGATGTHLMCMVLLSVHASPYSNHSTYVHIW